jgi:enterochelin esterase-like enzyme
VASCDWGRILPVRIPVTLWDGDEPLVVVHDGPEYAHRGGLRRALDGHSAALLAPVDRDETYSASAAYSHALVEDVLPSLPGRRPVGLGCSLGALALLHAHRRAPGAFAGLFLQSGSFFRRRDSYESGFPRYGRIARFVGSLRRDPGRPIPVTITVGLDEENLANNRALAETLAAGGYDVELHETRGGHDWPMWKRQLKARLPDLLERAWST